MFQSFRALSLVGLLAVCLAGPACAQTKTTAVAAATAAQSPAEVAARLGDRTITVADLDKKWLELDAASYMRSTEERYDIHSRVLDLMIGDYLVDQEAKRRNLTPDQLLAQELPKRTAAVTDADLETAYTRMQGQMKGASLAQVRPSLTSFLERQRQNEARQRFVDELRAKATGVAVSLEPPRYAVPPEADAPARGGANAPVEIVEFSDFQCPYCGRATPTIAQIEKTFGDKVKVVFRNFPLTSIHPQAYQAAAAAECALQQGKFWQYHDALFANQRALAPDDLKRRAADLGLDGATFAACLDGGKSKARVDADLKAGESLGISATPAFFVNGRFVSGAQPYGVFEKIINEELARAGRR